MAKNHLQDLNNDFNLKKFVFIFDRGYGSYWVNKLALLKNESKFIIRLGFKNNKNIRKTKNGIWWTNLLI